jgi:uncharacterized YokU family protein
MSDSSIIVCEWCQANQAKAIKTSVFWELPDGNRAIEITNTPSIECQGCDMLYQQEETVNEIEDQLLLIDTKVLDDEVTYDNLMKVPRKLKRNYFRY